MPEAKKLQGKRIVDAKHPLTIQVKEQDIRSSKRANPGECAIAKTMMRDKHVLSARVGTKYALIEFQSHFERYQINAAARRAVKDFDTNATFQVGEYQLLPVSNSNRLTGKGHAKTSGVSKNKTPLARRPPTRSIFRAKQA